MPQIQNNKQHIYDLEERTLKFARAVAIYFKGLPRNVHNIEYGKQAIRSSGSVGANYIEANEALSKKDFLMRIKISRKEAKETGYWLKLSDPNPRDFVCRDKLIVEADELMKILSAIMRKCQPSIV